MLVMLNERGATSDGERYHVEVEEVLHELDVAVNCKRGHHQSFLIRKNHRRILTTYQVKFDPPTEDGENAV